MQSPIARNKHRILIVDDNPAIHSDFRKILCHETEAQMQMEEAEAALFGTATPRAGNPPEFELCSAHQGEEAVKVLTETLGSQARFSLAFVDVRMPPGMDGIQTTATLWQLDPDLQVVICTAYSDYSWDEMVAQLGHSDRLVLLKKPFDTVEVLQLASALTEKWRLLQVTKRRMEDLEVLVAERTRFLEESNEKLGAEIEQRVRREQSLGLQNEIISALADAAAPAETLIREILAIICERLGWGLGRLWLVESPGNYLRCAAFRGTDGQTAFRSEHLQRTSRLVEWPANLARGEGLAGEVWGAGQSRWISGRLNASGEHPQSLEAGLAFALRLEDRVTGVLEFRGGSPREEERALQEALDTVGSLIGHALERRKLEEQLRHSQKMDAIGHLAGGVAHDFNNILTVIRGYAELLKDKAGLESDVFDGLKQICVAADRASMLTRQLLTFSRKQIMQARAFDLNQIVTQTESMLRRIIREDISLSVICAEEPATVTADEGMIGQVLMNLACNARDAMPEGGQLTIRLEFVSLDESSVQDCAEARPGEFVCLSVEDTGCGIPSEDLPHIFEPFFTTKDIGRGTGLGLCTVHGIIKQHHGWIQVETRLGEGTRFRAFLPRVLDIKSEPDTEHIRRSDASPGETVLLVEDEEAVRLLAREILTRNGYRVFEAASGREALSVWYRHAGEIDMLLTDIVMPDGVSGADLAVRLRASEPNLPVLLVSGYSPSDLRNQRELPGASFLPKPYRPQKLVEMVRECLEKCLEAPLPAVALP